jgi:hypothetical protein
MVWCGTQSQFIDNRTLSLVAALKMTSCMLGEENTRKGEDEVES